MRDSRLSSLTANSLGGNLSPGELGAGLQPVFLLVVKVTKLNECLDHVVEPSVSEGSTLNGLSLRDVVELPERSGVSVRVTDEVVSGVGNRVRLGLGHQVLALNGDLLTISVEFSGVSESEQYTTSAPAELVSQWVVSSRGRRKTSAHADEAEDLSSLRVNVVDCGSLT